MKRGLWFTRLFAALLLRLYPAAFRSRHGEAYRQGAAHIWLRERGRVGAVRALFRVVRVMLVDALSSIPVERRVARESGMRRVGFGAIVTGWAADVRHATRSLVRRPAYTALVVGTLGLGIGVSAAVYGALDRVILRPLPYPDGDRLAYLALRNRELGWQYAPFDEVVERWRTGTRTVEAIETYRQLSMVRTDDGAAEVLRATGYSAGLPAMLGVRALIGRLPGRMDTDESTPPVVVLSEGYWRRIWGADPAVVGRTMRLNDTIFTIVGVWPERARLDYEGAPELFRALPADAESPRGDFTLVLAKLASGVAPDVVEAELAGLLEGVEDLPSNSVPEVNEPYGYLGDAYVRGLWMVFAGGIVLMIVAVVNAANLVLSRTSARIGEIGIRRALGGSRFRLLRLFLAESVALAVAGIMTGVVVAFMMERGLVALEPGRLVPAGTTGLQGRASLFAIGLATLSAFVCALVPLLHTRAGASYASMASSRATSAPTHARTILIAAQTALAVLLVTSAALVSRSMIAVYRLDHGIQMDRLVVIAMRVSGPTYDSPEARSAYFQRVREVLEGTPGAGGVTTSGNQPLGFSLVGGLPHLDGESEPELTGAEFVWTTSVDVNYFDVTRTPVLRGRVFSRDEEDVVVVNETFARQHGGDVVGRSVHFRADTAGSTIIGVVGDVRTADLGGDENRVQLYYPNNEVNSTYERFLVRTEIPPQAFLAEARRRLASIDPSIPLREATTGPALVRERTSRYRFVAFLLGGFALLGLLFAIAGVYGAVSLDVQRRIREVGVRIALGASDRQVALGVLRRGLAPVAVGATIGVLAALGSGPILESLLFNVPARDPISAATGLLIMLATAVLACLLPARRATRVDPASTLRAE